MFSVCHSVPERDAAGVRIAGNAGDAASRAARTAADNFFRVSYLIVSSLMCLFVTVSLYTSGKEKKRAGWNFLAFYTDGCGLWPHREAERIRCMEHDRMREEKCE